MRVTNTVLVLGACVIYAVLAAFGGRTSVNDGLGADGQAFAAFAINHDLQAGSAVDKLTPAFPLAAAIAYAVTGNVVWSFLAVNVFAFAALAWATCWILDLQSAPAGVKVAAVITLLLMGIPTRTSAFAPGQPHLVGIAALSLAAGASAWRAGMVTAVLQIAAVLASPIGIAAPLYGLWRNARRSPAATAAMVFGPALVVWLLVQYWARGGPGGLVDLMRFSRVRADVVLWSESLFILFGVYFLLTSLGGFTILLASDPRSIRRTVSNQPELVALLVPVVPFIASAGLDVPRTMAFLLPFWCVLLGVWAREHAASLIVALVLAVTLTLLTQHPWVKLDDSRYFVDWFPYSVKAGRVNVADGAFDATWRLRMFIAAGGLVACAAWRRSVAR